MRYRKLAFVSYTVESEQLDPMILSESFSQARYRALAEGQDECSGFVPVLNSGSYPSDEERPLFAVFETGFVFAIKRSYRKFDYELINERVDALSKQYLLKQGSEPDSEWVDATRLQIVKEFRPYSPVHHSVVRGYIDLSKRYAAIFTKTAKDAESAVTFLIRSRKEARDLRLRLYQFDGSTPLLALLQGRATHTSLALADTACLELKKDSTVTFNKVHLYSEAVKPFSQSAHLLKKADVHLNIGENTASFNITNKGVVSNFSVEHTFDEQWASMAELEEEIGERKMLEFACLSSFNLMYALTMACNEIVGGVSLDFEAQPKAA